MQGTKYVERVYQLVPKIQELVQKEALGSSFLTSTHVYFRHKQNHSNENHQP